MMSRPPPPPPLWLMKLTARRRSRRASGIERAFDLGAGLRAILLQHDVERSRPTKTRSKTRSTSGRCGRFGRHGRHLASGLLERGARRHVDPDGRKLVGLSGAGTASAGSRTKRGDEQGDEADPDHLDPVIVALGDPRRRCQLAKGDHAREIRSRKLPHRGDSATASNGEQAWKTDLAEQRMSRRPRRGRRSRPG